EIASLALQERMRREPYAQIQISRRRAAGSRFTLAGNPDARAVADARGDADIHCAGMPVVFEREPAGGAVIGILERQLDFVLDVAPRALACAPARAARGRLPLAKAAAAEEGREEVGEGILVPEHL